MIPSVGDGLDATYDCFSYTCSNELAKKSKNPSLGTRPRHSYRSDQELADGFSQGYRARLQESMSLETARIGSLSSDSSTHCTKRLATGQPSLRRARPVGRSQSPRRWLS